MPSSRNTHLRTLAPFGNSRLAPSATNSKAPSIRFRAALWGLLTLFAPGQGSAQTDLPPAAPAPTQTPTQSIAAFLMDAAHQRARLTQFFANHGRQGTFDCQPRGELARCDFRADPTSQPKDLAAIELQLIEHKVLSQKLERFQMRMAPSACLMLNDVLTAFPAERRYVLYREGTQAGPDRRTPFFVQDLSRQRIAASATLYLASIEQHVAWLDNPQPATTPVRLEIRNNCVGAIAHLQGDPTLEQKAEIDAATAPQLPLVERLGATIDVVFARRLKPAPLLAALGGNGRFNCRRDGSSAEYENCELTAQPLGLELLSYELQHIVGKQKISDHFSMSFAQTACLEARHLFPHIKHSDKILLRFQTAELPPGSGNGIFLHQIKNFEKLNGSGYIMSIEEHIKGLNVYGPVEYGVDFGFRAGCVTSIRGN